MSLVTHLKYQQAVFHGLHFTPCTLEYGTLWSDAKHPEHGSCLVCERPGLYTLTVADYIVASDFSVPFSIRQPFLRFGSFYEGHTSFEIEGFQTSTSLCTARQSSHITAGTFHACACSAAYTARLFRALGSLPFCISQFVGRRIFP